MLPVTRGGVFLGYDPGGAGGVAVLDLREDRSRLATASVRSVDEAFGFFRKALAGAVPTAAGMDTLLYWETGRGGWRQSDLWLRKRYPDVAKSVVCSNSMYGAMAVQGMAFAMRLRETWPDLFLCETHPKVLYRALAGRRHSWGPDMDRWLLHEAGCPDAAPPSNEHEWDALVSAWAASKWVSGIWTADLRAMSATAVEPAGRVAYPWPPA